MNHRFNSRTMALILRVDLDLFKELYAKNFTKRFICTSCGINWKQYKNIREYLGLPARDGEV